MLAECEIFEKMASKLAEESFSFYPDPEWGKGAVRYDIHHDGKNVASAIVRPNPRNDLGGLTISELLVHKDYRSIGLGRRLLQYVKKKNSNSYLYLRPDPYKDAPLTVKQLRAFYASEGFIPYDSYLMRFTPTRKVGE